MRLLFVIPEYPPHYGGGIGTVYGALLPAFARRGHEVHALVGSAFVQGGEPVEQDGVHVRFLDSDRFARALNGFSRYAPMPELRRYLAAAHALWEQAEGGAGFDAVEVTDWGLLFAPWVVGAEPPVAVELHGSSGQIAAHEPDPSRALESDMLRVLETGLLTHAGMLGTPSRSNAREWSARLGREVQASPPPLVAPPVQADVSAPRGYGFAAGRLQAWKGPHVLAEALSQLGDGAPVVEWAGRAVPHPETGEPFDTYLARRYPAVWGSSFRAVGLLRPEEVAQRQASAAFVVVPSVWDVFNLTVAEAMQQGAVVVCSAGAGAADLIVDGESGFVVPSEDAQALAAALDRATALSEPERRAIGTAARATVEEQLDPNTVAAAREARFQAMQGRTPTVADTWLQRAVQPGPQPREDLSFLAHLPLRALAGHVGRRTLRSAARAARRFKS